METIKFTVGEMYKNEKGLFEILAIKGEEMVIRWESGEEITCDMRLQRRIQERRRWEKRRREKLEAAKLRSVSPSKASLRFKGLIEKDFQDKVGRTPWRSRTQLGGAVTRQLRATNPGFNSWAARRRNAVHWADARHWRERPAGCGVKFSARANGAAFMWGLHLIRKPKDTAAAMDWQALTVWLAAGSNEMWFRELALKEALSLYDAKGPEWTCLFSPGDDAWIAGAVSGLKNSGTLLEALNSLPDDAASDLMIARQVPAQEALGRGEEIARDIAELLQRLAPFYRAVTRHPDR